MCKKLPFLLLSGKPTNVFKIKAMVEVGPFFFFRYKCLATWKRDLKEGMLAKKRGEGI